VRTSENVTKVRTSENVTKVRTSNELLEAAKHIVVWTSGPSTGNDHASSLLELATARPLLYFKNPTSIASQIVLKWTDQTYVFKQQGTFFTPQDDFKTIC
jgi:hypothetical protein